MVVRGGAVQVGVRGAWLGRIGDATNPGFGRDQWSDRRAVRVGASSRVELANFNYLRPLELLMYRRSTAFR